MAIERVLWYKRIVKEQYYDDMDLVQKSYDWLAVRSKELVELMRKCFGNNKYDQANKTRFWDIQYFPYRDGNELLDIHERLFDIKTGLFTFAHRWNIFSEWQRPMINIEEYILPFITEKVIVYQGSYEPNMFDNESIIKCIKRFEDRMKNVNEMYNCGGVSIMLNKMK